MPKTVKVILSLTTLFSEKRRLTRDISFKDRTGRTQGIRFNKKPPKKAKTKIYKAIVKWFSKSENFILISCRFFPSDIAKNKSVFLSLIFSSELISINSFFSSIKLVDKLKSGE